MPHLFIAIIIALLVAGFLFWAIRALVNIIPLDPMFKQVINVLLLIAVVAIILFYVVIPLLNELGGMHIGLH